MGYRRISEHGAEKKQVGAGDDSFGNGLSVLHSNKSFEEKENKITTTKSLILAQDER